MRVLIVSPGWVGDLVIAGGLIRGIQANYPGGAIDVLAPSWAEPMLARMPGDLGYVGMPVGHGRLGLAERWRIGRSLHGRYDWALVLPNSWKSALIPAFAGIERRTGWRGEMRYGLLNDCPDGEPNDIPLMVGRYAALAGITGGELPTPRLQPQRADAVLARLGLSAEAPVLVLCPGARFGESRRWPARHYVALGRHYAQQGWSVWLLAAAEDAGIAEDIGRQVQSPRLRNLAGQTELGEVVDLMALAQLVVSNDSGLMHIAAALDVLVVGIFGSTSSLHTPPLGRRALVQELSLACRPCMQRECPFGHTNCLQQLLPEQVIAAVEAVL